MGKELSSMQTALSIRATGEEYNDIAFYMFCFVLFCPTLIHLVNLCQFNLIFLRFVEFLFVLFCLI